MRAILKKILVIVLAATSVISLNIVMNQNISFSNSMLGNNVIIISEFIIMVYIIRRTMGIKDERLIISSWILAFIFSVFHNIGTSINMYMSLNGIIYSADTVMKFIIKLIGEMMLFYSTIVLVYQYINKLVINISYKNQNRFSNKKTFLWSFIFILICWIPYLLTYYPGLTTGDSMNQIFQVIGVEKLSGHHPLIHTGLIYIAINLGKQILDYNLGVAIYTIVQMIIMASIFSYTIYYMKKINMPIYFRIIALLFYGIYPINPLFSLIMWKDIIFAGLMLLFIINTHKFISNSKENIKKFDIILYIINIVLLILFRNNGIYVVLLMMPFIFILKNKNSKKICSIFIIALISYFIINSILYFGVKAEKGQIREALSIPMQQFARVLKYHKEDLTEQEIKSIYRFIPNENIDEIYIPTLSDPVKNNFDSKAFSDNKIEFIKLWTRMFVKFPRAYIESFLCNSYGYWFPEAQNWVANRDVEPNNLGIHQDSKIQNSNIKKFDSIIEKRNIPIVSMLFSIGFMFWCILFFMMYCVYRKNYNVILIYIPILILWLTTLASPVFCEFRYVYSFITCIPLLATTIFEDKNKEKRGEKPCGETYQ